jgi:hypothetical protein
MTSHTYALVEWIDSAWFDISLYFAKDDPRIEPIHFQSVGILIKDDETGVALATDYTPDRSGEDKYRDVMFVPRVAVVKVTRLMPIPDAPSGPPLPPITAQPFSTSL